MPILAGLHQSCWKSKVARDKDEGEAITTQCFPAEENNSVMVLHVTQSQRKLERAG
jgi:hypothetical protein